MKYALVTGATGFIGRFFVPFLLQKNLSVRVLVREKTNNIFPEQVHQFVGDLTDPSTMVGVAEGVDIVFHLGGYAHAGTKNKKDEIAKHYKVNFEGTQVLLNECIRAHVGSFVYFSSVKAVADSPFCVDEAWDASPETPYGKAKRAAEDSVIEAGKSHQIHTCILRLSLVYGPGLKGNLYTMLRAIDKRYFLPIPAINNRRSLVNIYDVCQAAWLVAQHEKANGKKYIITDEQPYSTYFLYKQMNLALGRTMPKWSIPYSFFRFMAGFGERFKQITGVKFPFDQETLQKMFGSSEYSSLQIQKELAFQSQYSFTQLLPEMVRAYKEAHHDFI